MLDKRINRRRFLGAAALVSAGAGLGLSHLYPALSSGPPSSPSFARVARANGPRHLAWAWQFNVDGPPDRIASVLSRNYLGVLFKTHDGTNWMSRYDRSMHAVSGPQQVTVLANYFESWQVPFHAWYVAKGLDPYREAEMCAQVIDAGARSMTIDLEPFKGFWQGTPQAARAFCEEFRRRQPAAALYLSVDPRPWIISQTPVAEFAPFIRGFAPMTYWGTFNSWDNWRLFQSHGFRPEERGICPEFVLDVAQSTLGSYNIPIRPVGQGASRDPNDWGRFVSHAYELGMDYVSVWRYGVTGEGVWPLLKEMEPLRNRGASALGV